MLPEAVIWFTPTILLLSKLRSSVAVWLPKSSPPTSNAAIDALTFENPRIDKVPLKSPLLAIILPLELILPEAVMFAQLSKIFTSSPEPEPK